MEVTEASFNEIISQAGIQFVIPIWQRLYSWEEKEWNDLWDDLINLYKRVHKGESAEHFLGPMVVKTIEEKVGVMTKRILIDGQQRLTTLILICALLRNMAKDENNNKVADEIEDTILFNRYARKSEDKNKLVPTEADRKLFNQIVNAESLKPDYGSQLYFAYDFFKNKLESSKDLYEPEGLLSTIRGLKLVTIRLDERDNPNRIFETLNYRGKELAQIDLVRNYFMMAIKDATKADQIYESIWYPMQQNFGTFTLERIQNFERFLRHYVIMNKHSFVKENEIYSEIRQKLYPDENQVISELKTISKYSQYYVRLLYPSKEENPQIRKGIERLNRFKVLVHYPFLLKVYHAFTSKDPKISKDDFEIILWIIESYIVRRFFCKVPTNSLNRVFASLCELPNDDLTSSFLKSLAKLRGVQYWPGDDEFKERFQVFPIYKSVERCHFVLETLEESFGHPEEIKPENLTIEHIMPETLSEDWKSYLGADWENIHNKYLNTIGNLTLIGGPPNSMLQNILFPEKKEKWYLISSNVELTKEITKRWDKWTGAEIKERSRLLAERAVERWPGPK